MAADYRRSCSRRRSTRRDLRLPRLRTAGEYRMLDRMAKPKRKARQRTLQAARPIQAQYEPLDVARPRQSPSQRSVTEMLERLKRGRSARDEAEATLDAPVDRAVDLGIGWPEIAAQLGVTRQAARQRYQRRHGSR